MEMIGYLGKKVDLTCKDGKQFSGYIFDVLDAEDSDIGRDCVDIDPIDSDCIIEIPVDDMTIKERKYLLKELRALKEVL